jgi:hopanoid biosynthesis associated radical SAM protein HpnH
MPVPLSQMWTVATYVLGRKLRGVKRYPLVLMLEPLFRCNLACAGCGKIQHPQDILRRNLTPQQCFNAAEECGAPVISIPGGEPLLHPQIDEIVAGLVRRKRYVYLCTNAIKLVESLPKFVPSKYLAFSVHIDGLAEDHDRAVCRDGVFDVAIDAIKAAKQAGFRVTTNTTLYNDADPDRVRAMFDELMALGVEGMMISPGYSYEKAPDQEHFLQREQTVSLFQQVLGGSRRSWRFNQTSLFLDFLQGGFPLDCTPWGSPTYNVFGWQKPCYLLSEGYTASFAELMTTTDWSGYGHASGNAKCQDCMVHCGFEPSAVEATFGTWHGFWRTVKATLLGPASQRPALSPSPVPIPHRISKQLVELQPRGPRRREMSK